MGEIEIRQIQCSRGHVIPAKFAPENYEHRQHERNRRGKNAVSAANIKITQTDRAALRLLVEQKRSDEISRDDKEDANTQVRERSGDVRVVTQFGPMANDDQRNRNRAQTVEGRNSSSVRRIGQNSVWIFSDERTKSERFSADFPSREYLSLQPHGSQRRTQENHRKYAILTTVPGLHNLL